MKILSTNSFKKASQMLKTKGRQLEKQVYAFYFNDSPAEDLLSELGKFQNEDGGFGDGIEPDFTLPASSPMATTIGFQHLIKLEPKEEVMNRIKAGVRYLEHTYDERREGWFAVPKDVNDFAHAPWWHYDPQIRMTRIDQTWGNPTAELIGYLYKYRDLVQTLDVEKLVQVAIKHLMEMKEFEEHELYCYVRLYEMLPDHLAGQMREKLTFAIQTTVSKERADWVEYVPYPLNFISTSKAERFDISQELIDENLDYLVELLETNGQIEPTWQWGVYETEWETARQEWTGVLTLKALIALEQFGRIER